MEHQKTLTNEPQNKDVGFPITDGEIRRRLSRFQELITSFRKECRSEILPIRGIGEKTSIKGKQQQGILISAKTGARPIEQSNCLDTMYHKGLGSNQERTAVIEIKEITKGVSDAQRIYDPEGIAKTIKGLGGGQGAKTGLYAVLTPDRENKRQNGRRIKNEGEPMFTLTGQDKHGVMEVANCIDANYFKGINRNPGHASSNRGIRDGTRIRRLTPIECERLQSFPDGWTEGFSDSQRYKMMGNAVTVNVIKAIAEKL